MRLEPGCKGGREIVCYNIFGARDVDNITGELRDVGEMLCLSGGPLRRRTEKGGGERLMIGEKGKLKCFEEETKMANGGVSCKEFTIKGGVLGFGGG